MGKVIEVIYENGVFKPLEKLDLPDKTRLKIRIEDIDAMLEKFSGLIESDITLDSIKRMRFEVKTWRE